MVCLNFYKFNNSAFININTITNMIFYKNHPLKEPKSKR